MNRWLSTPIHRSWLIAGWSLGCVSGIALALVSNVHGSWLLVAGLSGLSIAWPRPCRWLALVALGGGLLGGLYRGGTLQQALTRYEPYQGSQVILAGQLAQDAGYGSHGDQQLELNHVSIAGRPLPGTAWISLAHSQALLRGDTVRVRGVLKPGFGGRAASLFRAEVVQISRAQSDDPARRLRDRFAAAVHSVLPEPMASLGLGFVTGQHTSLPPELSTQLRVAGLTHAVVASGYNLTILVGWMRRLWAPVSKYTATIAGGGLVIGFVAITGLSPSMQRAGLVTGLSLAAWYYGRTIHPAVLLVVSAALTGWLQPGYVWGDIGWYLSFASFGGVLLLAPLLHRYFWGHAPPGLIRQIIVDSSAAQLMTLPITLVSFGTVSRYALLANVLILPFIPLAMVLTALSGLAGLLLPGQLTTLPHWAGLPANLLLEAMIRCVGLIAGLPDAESSLRITTGVVAGSYAALLLICLVLQRQTNHHFRTVKR